MSTCLKPILFFSVMAMVAKYFFIGGLAKAAKISVETIRFYQREGLLTEPPKPPHGYRRYDSSYLEKIRFIRQLRDLGFSIREIREWLGFFDNPSFHCDNVETFVNSKRREVEMKMAELKAQLDFLGESQRLCQTCSDDANCSVFRQLLNYKKKSD